MRGTARTCRTSAPVGRPAAARPRVALLLLLLLAPALPWAQPGPAGALPAAACPAGSEGVTVVVDFGNLPGGVQIRCVTEPVSSGFDALTKAGFTYDTAQRFPGLLCRIDGKPAEEPCVVAPPGDRYWAYWTASEPGAAWTYSDLGAGNRTPPPGSVEGWAFSDGCKRRPQGPACPSAAPTTTRPPTTTTRGTAGGPTGGRSEGSGSGTTDAATSPTGGPDLSSDETTTTEALDDTTTSEVRDRARAPEPGEEGDEAAAAEFTTVDAAGGGSAAGALAGAGAAALVAGATVVTIRRRRGSAGEA